MSDNRQIRYGFTDGGIGISDDGVIFIDGVRYGRKEGNKIFPFRYGDPTLYIDHFGYVIGSYDGKTYGKLNSIGIIDYLEIYNHSSSEKSKSSESAFLHFANAYEKNSNTAKASGYSNALQNDTKKILAIVIALIILIVLLLNAIPFLIAFFKY